MGNEGTQLKAMAERIQRLAQNRDAQVLDLRSALARFEQHVRQVESRVLHQEHRFGESSNVNEPFQVLF